MEDMIEKEHLQEKHITVDFKGFSDEETLRFSELLFKTIAEASSMGPTHFVISNE